MCALWVTDGLTMPTLQTPAGVPEPWVKAIRLSGRIDWEKPDDSELEQLRAATGTLMLFGDPSLRSAARILRSISEVAPSLRVIGGTTGSSRSPGATRLFLDGQMHTDGLIAALISPQVPTHATVTQGCTAFGAPMLATKAERNVMYELDGRSALEVVQELLATVALDSRPAARDALRIGVAQTNEPDHNPIHYFGVLGADKEARSIMVEDEIGLGATVQFALRDARSATEDLVAVLSTLPQAQACLAFTSGSRNLAYFGSPHHEASVISDALPAAAVWGLSCFDVFGSNTAGVQVLDQSASLLTFPGPERRDLGAI
jgi:small ligand-binding sensory domain FIST